MRQSQVWSCALEATPLAALQPDTGKWQSTVAGIQAASLLCLFQSPNFILDATRTNQFQDPQRMHISGSCKTIAIERMYLLVI